MAIHALGPLTWDITVHGRMPSQAVYDASLRLLREVAAQPGQATSALRATTLTVDERDAWVALHQAGCLETRCPPVTSPTQPFAWATVHLTAYGSRYLAERT